MSLIYNQALSIAKHSIKAGAVLHSVRIASRSTVPPFGCSLARHLSRPLIGIAVAAVALTALAGCGNQYRPVVTAINPVGPAVQPTKYAVAISQPGGGSAGLMTMVDFAGDTNLININVGPFPYYLYVAPGGGTGFTLNNDGTLSSFAIATNVQTSNVQTTTLLTGAAPNSIFATSTFLYLTDPGRTTIEQLENTPPSLRQELPVTPGYTPVYIAGIAAGARAYAISQSSTAGAPGVVAGIETATSTISTTIPVGVTPVYGVMTADGRRAFILNQGSNSVSVINSQSNMADLSSPTVPVGTAPVWADLAPTRTELVVANAGDGVTPGTVSIVNIPLCTSATLPTNPNCDQTNPVDAVGFGNVLATIPVGIKPVMVTVLQDGTQAYVANYADSTVSAINLQTNTVVATIPVSGRPIYIASTTGTPTGKVYVVTQDSVSEPGFPIAPNSSLMTIIRTDTNTIESYVDLQGKGISVRMTLP